MSYYTYRTKIGEITLEDDGYSLIRVDFGSAGRSEARESPLLRRAAAELLEYLAGERTRFGIPLAPRGTPFQLCVWEELRRIPYGETRSYGQVAAAIGRPKACRAVGMANNRNPLSIFIPCHRVIGANGSLTGYGGGLAVKEFLLALEGGGGMTGLEIGQDDSKTKQESETC